MTSELVFITGVSGFIGRHAAKAFAACGYRVVGINRSCMPEASEWGVTDFQQSEISVAALVAAAQRFGQPYCLAHCAGSGSVSASLQEPHTDFCANVLTSAATLEFSRQLGSRVRVLLLSSAAVYGGNDGSPLHEGQPPSPLSPYGEHKKMAEDLALAYAHHFGVPSLRLRLFSIYGAGLQKQLLWDACNKALRKDFSFAGTGMEQRDWLHVKDAARLLALSADYASPESPIVNGASGKPLPVSALLCLLGNKFSPPLVPRFSREKRSADPIHLTADISRSRAWGFSSQISLENGIAEYVDWFRSQNFAEVQS